MGFIYVHGIYGKHQHSKSIQKHVAVKHDGFCNSNKALKGCVLEAHFKDYVLWNVLFSDVLGMTEKREQGGFLFFFFFF